MDTTASDAAEAVSVEASADGRTAWNPLARDGLAHRWSSYLGVVPAGLVPLLRPESSPAPVELAVHERLRESVLRADYPCLGARSSFHRRLYRFGVYPEMACEASVRAVCHDLYEFAHEMAEPNVEFATFITCFLGPRIASETHFEEHLWSHLQQMHDLDASLFAWDPSVSSDPGQPSFSFSIGGHAYYVVGLHPSASRMARRFAHPTIVFNLHSQFALLREQDRLELLKRAIRERDVALQGSVNPMLVTHGSGSQARQYSGRAVNADWPCPFRPDQNRRG